MWHLPLFSLHGVPQYGGNFALFAVSVIGNALLLGWLYAGTGSILLCVLFHAASNTASSMGLDLPGGAPSALWGADICKLLLGLALVAVWPGSAARMRPQRAPCAA